MVDFARAAPEEIRAHVDRALAGDSGAMNVLVRGIAPTIQSRIAYALLRRHGAAKGRNVRQELEDLVQETFAELYAHDGRALRAWDPARGHSFLGFVGFLAERQVAQTMRRSKRNPWTEDPTMDETLIPLSGVTESPENEVAGRQILERLGDQLRAQLSPLGWNYFHQIYVDGREIEAVSKDSGASIDAIYAWRSRLGRLLKKLLRELSTEET